VALFKVLSRNLPGRTEKTAKITNGVAVFKEPVLNPGPPEYKAEQPV
jgi:hypothetical protein